MDPGAPRRGPLTSWKEIAAFFRRDVRTVQRWEKTGGLPVRRHKHQNKSSVYADQEELEAWWRGSGADDENAADGSHGSVVADDVSSPSDPLPVPIAREGGSRWIRRTLLAVVASAAGLLLIVPLWWNSAGGDPSAVKPAAPLPPRLVLVGSRANASLSPGPIADLNGDGKADVIFQSPSAAEVYVIFSGGLSGSRPLPASADVVIWSSVNGDLSANHVADVDGDGLPDLILSLLLREPESFHGTGASYIVRGRARWPGRLRIPEDADVSLQPRLAGDIRMMPCPAGRSFDLNGDGIDDIVLGGADGSPKGRKSAGSVFILFGRRDWPRELDPERAADVTIQGSRTGEGLSALCGVGDFNGDGRLDLALTAQEETLWNLLGGRGRTYLWFGRDRWPAVVDAADGADVRVDGVIPSVSAELPVLADVNGDGRADLVTRWATHDPHLPASSDRISIWFGGPNHSGVARADATDVVIDAGRQPTSVAAPFAASDLDGDGFDDLLVSDVGAGRLHVLFGRRDWPGRCSLRELGAARLFQGEEGAGATGLAIGDIDADRSPEIALAAKAPARGWIVRASAPLSVDVRPGAVPNILYYPGGILVVRLPGRSSVSAADLDPATLRLAGVGPERHVWRDFDNDGVQDLQAYFNTSHMQVTRDTTSVTLTGRTRAGLPVAGTDTVVVVDSHARTGDERSGPVPAALPREPR